RDLSHKSARCSPRRRQHTYCQLPARNLPSTCNHRLSGNNRTMAILDTLQQRHRENKKSIAVLVDPDKAEDPAKLLHLINLANENCIDYFFVGGSLVTSSNLSEVVKRIKENVTIPIVLFPGNAIQVDASADAILFLSL